MNSLILCNNVGKFYLSAAKRFIAVSANRFNSTEATEIIDPPDNLQLAVLNYERRRNDPMDVKKARLLYQSRKRGMLENGILLSSFAAKYLANFDETETDEYDKLINLPSNDWDLFYWAMGMKPTPEMFDTEMMKLLKDHLKVLSLDSRYGQNQPPIN